MRSDKWQSERNRMAGILAAAGAALVLTAAGVQAAGCKQDPDQPKCSGGGGGDSDSVVPLSTSFDCASGDGGCPLSAWVADGDGAYLEGSDNVKSRLSLSGNYVLTMHERQNQAGTRKVYWDLGLGPADGTVPDERRFTFADANGLQNESGDFSKNEFDHKTIIQAGKHSGIDLRTLGPGASTPIDILFDLVYFGPSKKDQGMISVRYAGNQAPDQCPAPDPAGPPTSSTATATRTDNGSGPRTWTIYIDPNDTACVYDSTLSAYSYEGVSFGGLTLTLEEM